jgi:hypothetical protein
MKKILVSTLLLSSLVCASAQAALLYRGNGMAYDTVLDVTWLMDANYTKTSGYHVSGSMTWGQAMTWAGQLEYGGLTGWRLPRIDPLDPTCSTSPGYGHHCSSELNEIGYMLYVNLGLRGYNDQNNVRDPLWSGANGSLMENAFIDPSTGKSHSIKNLLAFNYWSGQLHQQYAGFAWYNGISPVSQNAGWTQTSTNYAWAVIDGDVAPFAVPVVGVGALGVMVLGFAGLRRHRQRRCA